MLYEFYIEDCVPCEKFSKTLKNLDIEYTPIDAEENKKMCIKYNIDGYPTLVLTKEINGQEMYDSLVGNTSLEKIVQFLDPNNLHEYKKIINV